MASIFYTMCYTNFVVRNMKTSFQAPIIFAARMFLLREMLVCILRLPARKVNLKNNFKELVEKKLSRYDRIFEENADAHVVVTVEHNRQTVEITIRQSGLIFPCGSNRF